MGRTDLYVLLFTDFNRINWRGTRLKIASREAAGCQGGEWPISYFRRKVL
jgi:hypothetical protein